MAIEWISVVSSNVEKIGYDKLDHTLGIIFKNNSEYHYPDVEESVYEELMNSESKGGYVSSNIKYTYSFRRVR